MHGKRLGRIYVTVTEFFSNEKLLRVNNTIIALIPKVSTPSKITDYRPISCCNVIYKCISRIITTRMKDGLMDIVSDNQSAFIPGRSISDNILLTQELMKNYHIQRGTPRCTFKIDIQKAYDTVDWSFLRSILFNFGFHHVKIDWIMACVTSTSFSISYTGICMVFSRKSEGTDRVILCLPTYSLLSWKF